MARPSPPAARCGPPDAPARVVSFATADGVGLNGAALGSGTRGVLLIHESGSRALCGWWPYAVFLANHGFRVLLFDQRCAGDSGCPPGQSGSGLVADVRAAVGELTALGARTVSLVGASLGGSVALVAAARLGPPVISVAALSADELTTPVAPPGAPTTAQAAAPAVRVPVMYAVARGDRYVSVEDTRRLYAATPDPMSRLVVLPAAQGHGWDLLANAGLSASRFNPPGPFSDTLVAFLRGG